MEGQNASDHAWFKVQTRVIWLRSMLATHVPRMRNSNHLIQIRITVSSGHPQIVALDFVVVPIPYQTSTLQCQKV